MRLLRCRRRSRGRLRLTPASGKRGTPRVLLIAPSTSYRIPAYLEAASRLGVTLLIASDGAHSIVPQVADGLHVDFNEPGEALARITEAGRREKVSAIVATDDATVELAGHVAQRLGLRANRPEAARIARRKDLARAALAAAGVPVPAFRRLDLRRDLDRQIDGIDFPCVIKPLAMAASRGVIRADDGPALTAACRRVAAIIEGEPDEEERRHVLAEGFVPGREVALEGILERGELNVLAIFDKPDPLDGPFFEETYYITPSRLGHREQCRLRERVIQACTAYGLSEGPVHAEVRIDDEEAWIIEIAARTIGGDCARLLEFGTGCSLEELVLSHALGRPLERTAPTGAAGVLMIPTRHPGTLRRVEGLMEAQRVPGVVDVEIILRSGYELLPLPEGGSYLGFVFAEGESPDSVESALRRAHECLNVVVAPMWRLQPAS